MTDASPSGGMASLSSEDKAAALLQLHNLPDAMKTRQQWLLWRFMKYEGDKKPRKVPHYATGRKRHGNQGSEEDRRELVTFDVALAQLARGGFDGIGFAFLPGDGLIGIDIDGAIDPETGEVSERCSAIVEACASYTEYSPSGKGVHIIVEGETETFKDNSIGLEVFCGRQFFTCTGRMWAQQLDQVRAIDEQVLRRLRATVQKAKEKPPKAKPAPVQASEQPAVGGGDDFARVNDAAIQALDAWVPALFPAAERRGAVAGGYRVTSKALGRDLQEDLTITPQGIVDWGVADLGDPKQGRRTPIDLVVEWLPATPKNALEWLAKRTGVALTPKPEKKKRKRAEAPDDAGGGPPPRSSSAGGGDEPDGEDPNEWRRQLLRTSEGGIKDCRENVFMMLLHHPALKGLAAFDEFSHSVMKMRKPPWTTVPGEWTNNDDYELGLFLATQCRLVVKGEATIVAGVAMAAFRAKFHPVRRYLEALPAWDGTERLPYWLHECLGAKDTTYERLVGTMFVLGMVNRVRNPGCQMDNMIVLEGGQGAGKSTALRVLAGDYFADTPIRIGDKDALLNLAGVWLYEVAELDAFNKAEVTAVKQYVSSRCDRVREPFARRPADRPRSCVLAGTTNQHEYFKDPTGSRRFWPVAVADQIDLQKLRDWRDQMFAEALHRLDQGERYHPSREEIEQFIKPEQESREITDPWFERIAVWVDAPEQALEDTFTSADILTKALYVPTDRIDNARQMATRVGIAMRKLGWSKARDKTGARLWRYVRPGKAAKAAEVEPAVPTGGPAADWSPEEWEAPSAS